MASDPSQIYSLGSGNDFILYMFKDDIEMFRGFERGSRGSLLGLWTNNWNPVVHIVHPEGVFPESYKALQSPEWKNDNAKDIHKVVATVGYWYCIDAGEEPHMYKTQDQRFVHLVVTKANNIVNLRPVRWCNTVTDLGKIERLSPENPFRLDPKDEHIINQGGPETKDQEKEGFVATNIQFFERQYQQGVQGIRKLKSAFVTETKSSQWYLNPEAQQSLKDITGMLEQKTGNTVEIKRDEETRDIFLKFLFNNNEGVLAFPNDFPDRPATLYKRQQLDNSVKEISEIPCQDRNLVTFMERLWSALTIFITH